MSLRLPSDFTELNPTTLVAVPTIEKEPPPGARFFSNVFWSDSLPILFRFSDDVSSRSQSVQGFAAVEFAISVGGENEKEGEVSAAIASRRHPTCCRCCRGHYQPMAPAVGAINKEGSRRFSILSFSGKSI
ncbi:unnamed protein product [Linum trigynum]|uniref:Uncharacterized protein n=1 Tax=Linum trigynum TaxID=586398 RepID=A0AAV2EYH0_9ROSI